jgi:hypothetical protein
LQAVAVVVAEAEAEVLVDTSLALSQQPPELHIQPQSERVVQLTVQTKLEAMVVIHLLLQA